VLCPDGPVSIPGEPAATRLRELFGVGFAVLSHGFDSAVEARGPTRRYRLDHIDPDGVVTTALDAAPGWWGLVRPDGHLAAVLREPDERTLTEALARACGRPG
jgi:pentachlorophenol monooxygenase/3-(3-hydroxy-phenyl)propionate hydroxylase